MVGCGSSRCKGPALRRAFAYGWRRPAGFSLIELVLVLVILGIIAVVAVARLGDAGDYQARGFHDEIVSALRYGQKVAVTSGCPVEVLINAGTRTFSMYQPQPNGNGCDLASTNFSVAVLRPDTRTPFAAAAPAGVSLSPSLRFVFTPAGYVDPTTMAGDTVVTVGSRSFVIHTSGYVE